MTTKNNSADGSPKAARPDASYAEPRVIPDEQLLGRDDSGGIDYQPHTGQVGDGGYVTGRPKRHLSPRGGGIEDPISGDEQLSTGEARNRTRGAGGRR